MRKKILIMGAAGRDFHNFNLCFRNNSAFDVVAFTAAQIPGIQFRVYPPELGGKRYPKGIPIYSEEELPKLINRLNIDQVIFAYSDITNEYVMQKATVVLAKGASFCLLGSEQTMLKSKVPVISVCAVRTGSGKSQTSRQIANILKSKGLKVVVIRHPMPYGDLKKQIWQRFASYEDLEKNECTIEEREEYEPHIEKGIVVYAGVDYDKILTKAQKEAEIIVWDGGNNDIPFLKPDLHIVLADPHRAGDEVKFYPSNLNLRLANIVIINKVDTADPAKVKQLKKNIISLNPDATVLEAASPITVENPELIKGKRVLAIEDGPTITHGGMPYGAAAIAAKIFGAKELVDPKKHAVGSIKWIYRQYPHIGRVLPAVGYGKKQIAELEETIRATPCDVVLIGTPVDLRRVFKLKMPTVRVKYELQVLGPVCLEELLDKFLDRIMKS
jgi:predicted GTPase